MTREPVGHEWLQGFGAHFDEQFPEPASSPSSSIASAILTPDGTVIVTDSAGNSASGRTVDDALAKFGRKA